MCDKEDGFLESPEVPNVERFNEQYRDSTNESSVFKMDAPNDWPEPPPCDSEGTD